MTVIRLKLRRWIAAGRVMELAYKLIKSMSPNAIGTHL